MYPTTLTITNIQRLQSHIYVALALEASRDAAEPISIEEEEEIKQLLLGNFSWGSFTPQSAVSGLRQLAPTGGKKIVMQ